MSTDAPLMLSVSGCRGIVGASMTPAVATRFAQALAAHARAIAGRAPRVVLARDGRAGGHVLRDAALAGLTSAGAHVVDLDVAMTPTVGVMVDHLGADAGLVLTASHNPQQWNGLKPIIPTRSGAAAPNSATADALIDRFRNAEPELVAWDALGSVERRDDAADIHVRRVLDALGASLAASVRSSSLRVVLNSVNASGARAGAELMRALGCELIHLHADNTGLFPHTPEPTEENLREMCATVKDTGAAVGFAQDPDGDRLAIIDEHGRYVGEEQTLVLAATAAFRMEQRSGATVVTNLSTSRMIEDVASGFGADVRRAAVGEANVVSAMLDTNAPIGGEGNGGVIWPAVTLIRDSLSAMALVLAELATGNGAVSRWVDQNPKYEIVKRKTPLASREQAAPALARLADFFAGEARIDTQDGVRLDLDDQRAWAHVRPSNTEPILRLIAEAPTADLANALLARVESALASA